MATGALLQLESRNEFDDLLFSTDIKMSEFKSNYKPITNFAEMPYSFNPISDITWGERAVFKLNKVGDLLTNMYLVLELPEISVTQIIGKTENETTSNYRVKWQDYIGYNIIESAIMRIGGQIIQEMSGEYMMCYTDLYDSSWSNIKLCGHDGNIVQPQNKIFSQYIYVPLRFFNCGNYNSALPINALRYHEVEIEIKLREWEHVYLVLYQLLDVKQVTPTLITDPASYKYAHTHEKLPIMHFNNLRLDCNFVFLDSNERNYFLDNKLEMLITQVQAQHQSCNKLDSIYLDFYNPIKEIYFLVQKKKNIELKEFFNYSGKPDFIPFDNDGNDITEFTKTLWTQIPEKHLLLDANLQFNGVDRVSWKDYKYWYLVQNYETFKSRPEHYIYLYSFGLTNRKMSGSCNFSEIDSVRLNIRLADDDLRRFSLADPDYILNVGPEGTAHISIYGVNYNILLIEEGMAGLQFGM
jgi:hypothetical protein